MTNYDLNPIIDNKDWKLVEIIPTNINQEEHRKIESAVIVNSNPNPLPPNIYLLNKRKHQIKGFQKHR